MGGWQAGKTSLPTPDNPELLKINLDGKWITMKSTPNTNAKISSLDWLLVIAIGSLSLALYIRTLASGVLPGDSGEFQVLTHQLGIAHCPGYPVYLVIVKLFTFLRTSHTSQYGQQGFYEFDPVKSSYFVSYGPLVYYSKSKEQTWPLFVPSQDYYASLCFKSSILLIRLSVVARRAFSPRDKAVAA